jgi:hypothetical protein
MTNEQYIEHEVQLRVNDKRFTYMEKRLDKMEYKLNWIIGLAVSSILLPAILKYIGVD